MASRNIQRVVIVGCGVAGPALAMFLKRVDIDVVLCERRPATADAEGLFLGVAPNGMNVVKELGLHSAVDAIGASCRGFQFQNGRGRPIGVIDRGDDDARFGARLQMVRRGDLHRVLTDAARAHGVHVQFGRELVGLDRTADAIVARFADGGREQADALIGCDGIRSTVRQLTLPDAPMPAYSGLVDFGGITSAADVALPVGINVMVFGRRAFFGAFKTAGGEVWWFQNSGHRRPEAVLRDPAAARAHILDLHAADPSWIGDVVRSTSRVAGPFALHDILSMPRWHSGRVCLVGDAAHATTPSAGQGASLALEDAMVLAQCIRDTDRPDTAFATFERVRRARVETIVKQSRRTGNTKAVAGPIGEWIRDRILPLFLRLGAAAQEHHYAHRIDWTQRYA